jgi:DNA repair protein RecO (recombination protein O)
MPAFTECFLLHSRPYKDTSLLVDFFSVDYGRVSAVVPQAYQKKAPWKSLLQIFSPLNVLLRGTTDLRTVAQVVAQSVPILLSGQAQICGFYLNELLMYCLERFDAHPLLFSSYHRCLQRLQGEENLALILRTFELQLLNELGYGIDFHSCANSSTSVQSDSYYFYRAGEGFLECFKPSTHSNAILFRGEQLRAMANFDFSEKSVLNAAKYLTRLALQPLLNGRVIHSRQLFITNS